MPRICDLGRMAGQGLNMAHDARGTKECFEGQYCELLRDIGIALEDGICLKFAYYSGA
jgi:hypothetical protein